MDDGTRVDTKVLDHLTPRGLVGFMFGGRQANKCNHPDSTFGFIVTNCDVGGGAITVAC